jgi:hypothetical protein
MRPTRSLLLKTIYEAMKKADPLDMHSVQVDNEEEPSEITFEIENEDGYEIYTIRAADVKEG